MRTAIIGGGILGLSLGYFLSKKGYSVTIFEKNTEAGGQARSLKIDNFTIERYYHCILGSDFNLISLIKELGLEDRLFFVEATSGCYWKNKIYPISKPVDFLKFSPLSFIERIRLVLGSQYIKLIRNWKNLESVNLEEYLKYIYGKSIYDKFWRYLFKARFDLTVSRLPATYLWSRIQRYSPSNSKVLGWDKIGYLRGGYSLLINKLIAEIEKKGGEVLINREVKKLIFEGNRVIGLELEDGKFEVNRAISTIPLEFYGRLFPTGYDEYLSSLNMEYLNIICLMLISKKRLTPFHTLYILDEKSPFTGIIEITNLIDPSEVGGRYIIYLSKYISQGSPYFSKSSEELIEEFTSALVEMFPEYELSNIDKIFCFKDVAVEPIHCITAERKIPPFKTPIKGLYLINSTQVYPKIAHCDALIEMAKDVVSKME
jgi:protoporphyrinogen oxidase